uniref:Sodium/hydrogen exchanger, monovalent cation:H+ antiporter-2, CPA2 family n=1 Tax=uncultured Gemmatimonadetes bacterium Rifle_16ft_4_minimus_7 TaxID=1665098 RepID=A0A0H4T9P4_9BACT|nr:sodium/hydrogen exchanger, monovalent cation:H+ antiporter-2, CPA2 family [uncultured Gemmatimonadetes bacterium Rifle_16ft_4_minimus_7]
MHDFPILRDLVILVAAAIPVVIAAHRLRVPSVVAFLLTGIAIGPHGLGLIGRQDSVAGLAELGVLLLLFTIGLELSLSRVVRLGRLVLQGGGLQLVGTAAAVAAVAVATGTAGNAAVLYGALVALSSTAIVLRVYTDRGELDTPHGRVVVAVLLFQDLCVVPLMLLIPVLAGGAAGGAGTTDAIVRTFGLSLAVLAALVLGGRLLVPRVLERVAALRNREIFTLSIVLFGLGAAYVTASFGLSLAIGAFIAGLVIAESEYGLQALSDVLPFRDTFSGIFFISVGMLLDTGLLVQRPLTLLGAAAAVVLLKTVVAAVATYSLGRSLQVSVMSGLALAQVGEFSFVLAGVAAPLGLLPPDHFQVFLGASVASMLATPFVIAAAAPVAEAVCRLSRRPAIELLPHETDRVARLEDHVIIVGYGLNGRNLARVLRAAGIGYVILEQNGQVVRRARLEREPILFGDGTRHEVLERVGIAKARVIVFAISAPAAEHRGVAVARQLNPGIRIVVRTRYVAALDDLSRAGADEVVPEEFETSLEVFARVLRLYGIPSNTIEREVAAVRGEHYGVLRGLALPGLKLDALKHLGVHAALDTVEVEEGARAIGESPTTLDLRRETGTTLIAVVRDGKALYTPDPEFRFRAGDTVVLVGQGEALVKACGVFRAGH